MDSRYLEKYKQHLITKQVNNANLSGKNGPNTILHHGVGDPFRQDF